MLSCAIVLHGTPDRAFFQCVAALINPVCT